MTKDDLISKRAAIDAIVGILTHGQALECSRRISALPPAQPELIEKVAYIRGFEQGRTQGMIDSQGGKK